MASLVRVCSGGSRRLVQGGTERVGSRGRCLGLVLRLRVFVVDVAPHGSGVDTCTGQKTGG